MLEIDRIHCMDALEGLRQIADESVGLVVTDPPYAIASPTKLTMRGKRIMSTADLWGSWDTFPHPFDYHVFICAIIAECYRILRPGGALYMFTAREHNGQFVRRAVERGFVYRNTIAMVRKSPLPSLAKSNWRSGFELCLYVTKGKPAAFNFLSQAECNNVMQYGTRFKHSQHPTEKPLEVIRRIVEVSSDAGDLVVDPFMGSGTTAVAAKMTRRKFLGFEKSAEYVSMAEERLERVVLDGRQPSRGAA